MLLGFGRGLVLGFPFRVDSFALGAVRLRLSFSLASSVYSDGAFADVVLRHFRLEGSDVELVLGGGGGASFALGLLAILLVPAVAVLLGDAVAFVPVDVSPRRLFQLLPCGGQLLAVLWKQMQRRLGEDDAVGLPLGVAGEVDVDEGEVTGVRLGAVERLLALRLLVLAGPEMVDDVVVGVSRVGPRRRRLTRHGVQRPRLVVADVGRDACEAEMGRNVRRHRVYLVRGECG